MRSNLTILFPAVLAFFIAVSCSSTPSTNNTTAKDPEQSEKTITHAKFDTVFHQLITKSELSTADLLALKMIDSTNTTPLGESCYPDTTIQLNDSIYYSVIHATDAAGLCSYSFATSINRKSRQVIASVLLHPDCDVDYSSDSYALHEHSLLSKDKILVTNTTIFQKKKRTANEQENIDHKKVKTDTLTISQNGQISRSQ